MQSGLLQANVSVYCGHDHSTAVKKLGFFRLDVEMISNTESYPCLSESLTGSSATLLAPTLMRTTPEQQKFSFSG
jgi:hypothetical protein